MDSLFDVILTDDQRMLLNTMAGPWLETGDWPLWGNVQHRLDLRRKDADDIFHSLPRVGGEVPFAAGYGFTQPRRSPIAENDRIQLTVAACLVLPEVRMVLAGPFVRALGFMVELYMLRPVDDAQVTEVILRSKQLMENVSGLSPWFVKVLPGLLSYEPSGISGGGVHTGDGHWERQVNRQVLKFADVPTVEEYVERTTDLVMAAHDEFVQILPAEPEPAAVVPERAPYVDPVLLDDITAAARGTRWQVHKLVSLCEELNDSYVEGRPYASIALARAVLDHIPPLFGLKTFAQVAAQYSFPVAQTDKAHAGRLSAFREVAHDVMHRPISATVPILTMGDLPEPVRLNAMLQEVLSILRKEASGTP
ncbi:hypothetical protein ACF1AO_34140 [Streptomyces longwoodensis]|uniref:hypothetical protein n=1 Tax=Streptomyces longwoodensis TaxID=68231 RepID=UPI0036FCEB84